MMMLIGFLLAAGLFSPAIAVDGDLQSSFVQALEAPTPDAQPAAPVPGVEVPSTAIVPMEDHGETDEDEDSPEPEEPVEQGISSVLNPDIHPPLAPEYMHGLRTACMNYAATAVQCRRVARNHRHEGMDFGAPAGTETSALAEGTITEVRFVARGGYKIVLQTPAAQWVYRHLNRHTLETLLTPAQQRELARRGVVSLSIPVTRGQLIGKLAASHGRVSRVVRAPTERSPNLHRITVRGDDGYSVTLWRTRHVPRVGRRIKILAGITGPHLHLERRVAGNDTDPTPFLFLVPPQPLPLVALGSR